MLFDMPGETVARVCVDSPLPQLDRLFDYRIKDTPPHPVPGCRVRVPFNGKLVSGFVIEIGPRGEYSGRLLEIERVISTEPVVTPTIASLARVIADRYVGNLNDVLRLAVPARQARVETEQPAPVGDPPTRNTDIDHGWHRYHIGDAFMTALKQHKNPRIVWDCLPGENWPLRLAEAAATTAATGRGVLLVVPDQHDLTQLDTALATVFDTDQYVTLSAAAGPSKRYRAFLRVSRGHVRVVAGTRAAMFAPVHDLGLVIIWDDGDESHIEPHAPYPQAREVLCVRAVREETAVIVGSYTRSVQSQLLVETRWAIAVGGTRELVRTVAPRVIPVGDDHDLSIDPDSTSARLPSVAWRAVKKAIRNDQPVLVQTPRRGYIPAVTCQTCRTRAYCLACNGPLGLSTGQGTPYCRWCGKDHPGHTCAECGGATLRALIIGATRTAEELGRAFPGTTIHVASTDRRLTSVPSGASIVVSTPGIEPDASDGYGVVLLLDTWALLTRADLRAEEEAYRRWAYAAALARPDGTVVINADGGLATVQALLRWDPAWFASQELEQRRELQFPPAVRMASLSGAPNDVTDLLARCDLPASAVPVGPVPINETTERVLIRVRRKDGAALAASLRAATVARAQNPRSEPVRVQMDPRELW